MRGRRDPQVTMLAFVDLEERVPKDHPLRTIKTVADKALERLSVEFDRMYSKVGLIHVNHFVRCVNYSGRSDSCSV